MAILDEKPVSVFGATLSRREFVKAGGALLVGFSIVGAGAWKDSVRAATPNNTLDPTLPGSWIEIHPDNTILIRTGKSDFGQSTTFTALDSNQTHVDFVRKFGNKVYYGDVSRLRASGASVS